MCMYIIHLCFYPDDRIRKLERNRNYGYEFSASKPAAANALDSRGPSRTPSRTNASDETSDINNDGNSKKNSNINNNNNSNNNNNNGGNGNKDDGRLLAAMAAFDSDEDGFERRRAADVAQDDKVVVIRGAHPETADIMAGGVAKPH